MWCWEYSLSKDITQTAQLKNKCNSFCECLSVIMVKKGNGGVKLTYPWRPLLLLVIECFVLRHAQGERNENEQGDEEGAA